MRTTTFGIGIGLGLALLLPPAPTQARGDDETTADSILGTYTYESGKRGREEIEKDRLRGKVQITRDTILLLGEGGSEDFVIRYEFTPGEAGKPAKLKMEITKGVVEDAVGSRAAGLIERKGDTVRLLYDFQDGRTPDDLEPDDAMQHLFVLKAETK